MMRVNLPHGWVLTLALLASPPAMLPPNAVIAAETVGLGDGASIDILEYLIETSPNGHKTVVVMAKPNFDPEPFGAVPSDNFARRVEPLCAGLVGNSRDSLEAEGVGSVRVRWDFEPSYDTGSPSEIKISRFHEFVYDIDENWKCIPRPLGVGLDNLSPKLPSGLDVSLRYIEQGPRARQLALTYQSALPLEEVSDEVLENAAIELCIVHGDLILADRRRYYEQLEAGLVSIGFVQTDDRGMELERRVLFGVLDDSCNTGLSSTLADAIRETVAGGS